MTIEPLRAECDPSVIVGIAVTNELDPSTNLEYRFSEDTFENNYQKVMLTGILNVIFEKKPSILCGFVEKDYPGDSSIPWQRGYPTISDREGTVFDTDSNTKYGMRMYPMVNSVSSRMMVLEVYHRQAITTAMINKAVKKINEAVEKNDASILFGDTYSHTVGVFIINRGEWITSAFDSEKSIGKINFTNEAEDNICISVPSYGIKDAVIDCSKFELDAGAIPKVCTRYIFGYPNDNPVEVAPYKHWVISPYWWIYKVPTMAPGGHIRMAFIPKTYASLSCESVLTTIIAPTSMTVSICAFMNNCTKSFSEVIGVHCGQERS